MGKSSGKKKKQKGDKSDANSNPTKFGAVDNSTKVYDKDTEVFIVASQELKDEGNRLFQRRDYEGAMLKYEKGLKLLPRNHIDVAYIRSNMAACYMQMGICDYPRAVQECNLALEVSPKYTKALIKRSRCYEGLNRFELALRDINSVLTIEPNNLTALEIAERLKQEIGGTTNGVKSDSNMLPEHVEVEPPCASSDKPDKEKTKKKKCVKSEDKPFTESKEIKVEDIKVQAENKKDKKSEDKLVVEEKLTDLKEDNVMKTVKLVYGEDIRWAHLPGNCSLFKLREVIHDRYPNMKPVLVKYKDHEGDMVTITSDEELRWAEASVSSEGSVRLYIVEVDPKQDPFYEKLREQDSSVNSEGFESVRKSLEISKRSAYMDDWIIQFAQHFKSYVGFSSDASLDLHEIGVKLYSEAMEETVTSEEAQGLFEMAAAKFQEMTALALFNWGNVHMAQARKRVNFTEESPREAVLAQVKDAYEWAEQEYVAAGKIYEDALRTKPDFYEAHLALAQQQFEQGKLAWYYALANDVDLETWSYTEVLELYNNAEVNVERGMQIWEELEQHFIENFSSLSEDHAEHMQKIGLNYTDSDISVNEVAEQATKIRSQINVLWGSMLYERSIMEYKLQLPVWQECLEVGIEKFQQSRASQSELAVMIKNHCSNDSAIEGVGFKIDEIVQAWNEMDEAKRFNSSVPSFRLEPLLKRRASKIYSALEFA